MSNEGLADFFVGVFHDVQDPRAEQKQHLLVDILAIALCSTIAGGEGWDDMAWYGEAEEEWFRTFLELPFGIPSRNTFERVLSSLCPVEFSNALTQVAIWIGLSCEQKQVALDGKTLRRSYDKALSVSAIHIVSAFCVVNGICLGQRVVDSKSNEITAIPHLISILELAGRIVTIDAMGCQKTITAAIRAKNADYVLALKANHGDLFKAVNELFYSLGDFSDLDNSVAFTTIEKGHGRIETRTCVIIPFQRLWASTSDWHDLKSFIAIDSIREINGKKSFERRIYITSLQCTAEEAYWLVRNHWAIENGLHWQLDVTFNEDQSRVRINHGPENLSVLRKLALSLLKHEKSQRISIRKKRRLATMRTAYLEQVLQQSNVLQT